MDIIFEYGYSFSDPCRVRNMASAEEGCMLLHTPRTLAVHAKAYI